ncbi:MAG: sodium:proton antiporter, partial [Candidatus Kryptonium sp.]
ELELNKDKFPFILKTALFALLPILMISFTLAFSFHYFKNIPFKIGFVNSIPVAVISSSIAISSSKSLSLDDREFIIYESSLSDIFGIIIFNFFVFNDAGVEVKSIIPFAFETLLVLVVASITTLSLAFLLSRIKHHVKFIPIIVIIIMIYAISKLYHLPALILILVFGLFLGNIDKIKRTSKLFEMLRVDVLRDEVNRFKELTIEFTFLVRSFFFLLFGYLIETSNLLNLKTMAWAIAICALIYILRFILIKVFKLSAKPILFIAPRGLITVLLFVSIPVSYRIDLVNESLIAQVVVLTSLVMVGAVKSKTTDVVDVV